MDSSFVPRVGALAALPAPAGTKVLLFLALAKAYLGVAVLIPAALLDPTPSPWADGLHALLLALFTVVGGALLLGGIRDRRALYWGGTLILVAEALAGVPLVRLAEGLPAGAAEQALVLVGGISLEVFLPALLWCFALQFPSLPYARGKRRALVRGARVCWIGGSVLLGLQLSSLLLPEGSSILGGAPEWVSRHLPGSLYYPLLAAGALPALALLAGTLRIVGNPERLFLSVALAGLLMPTVSALLRPLLPQAEAETAWLLGSLAASLLLVPLVTAWSVWAHGVFDVRPIAPREAQLSVLRALLMAGGIVPIALFALYAHQERHQTLLELSSSGPFLALLLMAGAGLAVLGSREQWLAVAERRLFPELEDSPRSRQRLMKALLSCSNTEELAAAFEGDLRRRFALEGVALLVEIDQHLVHLQGAVRRLDVDTHLGGLLTAGEALEVDLEDPVSPLRDLPEEERHWLVDTGSRLLVPLRTGAGGLLACLMLREKPGELPFLPRERELLSALAGAAGLALELVISRQSSAFGALTTTVAASFRPARECAGCGRVLPAGGRRCDRCDRDLEEIPLPYILPGRLRLEERIGTGRVGVIYRASDLTLGRSVAVKTLPRLSPEDALRLRKEARTAASVSHPNLELIYGVETWRGTPMIVIELLEGGTLHARLRRVHRLATTETLALGIGLAGALEQLHSKGILHRDVKPGNIAFDGSGTPKLVDFDLARLQHDPRSDSWEVLPSYGSARSADSSNSSPPSVHRADWMESLYYRSPEIAAGEPASPAADLWSLHAVLFECLAGQRLYKGRRLPELLRELRETPIPHLGDCLPGAPERLAEYLHRALDRNPSRRPASAREARVALERMARLSTAPPSP